MAAKKKTATDLPVAILAKACEGNPQDAFRVLREAVEESKATAAECLALGDADGANDALENLRAAEEGRALLSSIGGPEAVALARKNLEKPAAAPVAEEEPESDDDDDADDPSMGGTSDESPDDKPGPEGGDRAAG